MAMGHKIKKTAENINLKIESDYEISSMPIAVRKLIENSLDASATIIKIKFIDFGNESIVIDDDGFGIRSRDLKLLCKRNCTSKLKSVEQLKDQDLYGFRGITLSSLCSLADLEITTRHKEDEIGTTLKFDQNCKIISSKKGGTTIGTIVKLSKLFKTNEMQRKELETNKKKEYENSLRVVHQYVMALTIKVTFIVNIQENFDAIAKTVFKSESGSLSESLKNIFFENNYKKLIPLEKICDAGLSRTNFNFDGFISKRDWGCGVTKPEKYQYFYVNQRPVEIKSMASMINSLYRELNPKEYPIIVLRFDLNNGKKTLNNLETFFGENEKIAAAVKKTIEQIYQDQQNSIFSKSTFQRLHVVGQFGKGYIMTQFKDKYYVIDPHALDERIKYESYLNEMNNPSRMKHEYVNKELQLDLDSKEIIENYKDIFENLGFKFKTSKGKYILIRVPKWNDHQADEEDFQKIIAEIQVFSSPRNRKFFIEKFRKHVASMACHSAFKLGNLLSKEDIAIMLQKAAKLEDPFHCAHNRSSVVEL